MTVDPAGGARHPLGVSEAACGHLACTQGAMSTAEQAPQTLDEDVVADFAALGSPDDDVFAEDATQQAEAIADAADRARWDEASRLAHGLKSAAAALGAMRVSGLCRDIEIGGREGGDAAVQRQARALPRKVGAAVDALRAFHAGAYAP